MANHSMFKEDQNPFEVLGLEPTFELDVSLLDKAYFARQTLAHPDRFIYHSEPERRAASMQASGLNHAYETLKNPILRAKALLKLRGINFIGEEERTAQDSLVLEEMMGLQEALAEAISPHDLMLMESRIQDRLQEGMTSFAAALCQDQNEKLSELFLRLTYLSKMMGDIKVRRRQSSVKVL